MRVIIAGSRSITRYFDVWDAIYDSGWFDEVSEVVSGGAVGVDRLGEQWANKYGIPIRRFLPDWSLGKGAGFARNRQMGDYADALVAVWDGESRGTAQMIEYMRSLGKPVHVHEVRDGV